jgi:hypothetical protein
MPYIEVKDARAWTHSDKRLFEGDDATVNTDLVGQVAEQVLSRLRDDFDVEAWQDSANTPALVKSVIAMIYVAWEYDKAYSTSDETSAYAQLLRAQASSLIDGLVSGAVDLDEEDQSEEKIELGLPGFEETEPVFMMGTVW